MSRNYRFHDQEKLYFTTFTTVQWVDVFTRPAYKHIFVESVKHCVKEKGLIICAWVIMSNHIHMIIGTRKNKLQDIIRDIKKFTSKTIIKNIIDNPQESRKNWLLNIFMIEGQNNPNNKKYQFWQQHNQPILLDSNYLIDQKLEYIHQNPVKAEIVENPWEYKYSSAIDYTGESGLIKITKIE